MSDDILSQDQIDALSQGADLSDVGSAVPADVGGTSDLEALAPAYNVMSEQAGAVLSTVLGKEVQVSLSGTTPTSAADIKTTFAKDHLVLNVQFEKGFPGQLFFLISKKQTAVLADLMMMGDGEAEYEDDHKDAIGELLNQIMGATSTSFGVQLNTECAVTPAKVEDFDPESTAIPLDECASSTFALSIQGLDDSTFLVLTPNETVAAIAEKASASSSAPAEEEAEAPTITADQAMAGLAPQADAGGDAQFPAFEAQTPAAGTVFQANPASPANINMLLDVQLEVAIELGRTEMSIKRILELGPGSIIELDRMAGEPIDLLVNGKVVAKGEVVVVDENFGIRIVSLLSPEERLKSLK